MRTAVLASGTGTILAALIDEKIDISVVMVDRQCNAEKIAEHADIPAIVVARDDFSSSFDRNAYTDRLIAALEPFDPDLVVLAGFGTIVGAAFVERFPNRVVNTHPALLPSFKGWHAVRDALQAGVKITGTTVHIVTPEVDEGPILAQEAVPVYDDDTEDSLHERIKQVERRLFPATVKSLIEKMEGSGSQ